MALGSIMLRITLIFSRFNLIPLYVIMNPRSDFTFTFLGGRMLLVNWGNDLRVS